MKYVVSLVKSILGGICISIGGVAYLMAENKIIGAGLFCIGLFLILSFGFYLYTGKIGDIVNSPSITIPQLPITLIGNFIGTFTVAYLLSYTRFNSSLVTEICSIKLNDSPTSIFILSIFCGILMYLGVNGYKNINNSVGKYLSIFFAVMVFILAGFEHCVANMFYFSLVGAWGSLHTWAYLSIMVVGNSIGSILIAGTIKFIGKYS